jgi:hypothetical protein
MSRDEGNGSPVCIGNASILDKDEDVTGDLPLAAVVEAGSAGIRMAGQALDIFQGDALL